jgi:hypothetical protein
MVRDKGGRFLKGHAPLSKGRPKRSTEERLLAVMSDCVTDDDWRDITNKAVERAKKGDDRSRQWLTNYLVGVPKQKVEHTGEDGGRLVIELVTRSAD